ncbi:MAG TPA: hypothetical protein VF516_25160 [Kofleriaceae bacterium]
MRAQRIHTVVAAGVDNPALIVRWRAEPELLRGHGVEPSQVDLDALWRFAGLTVKVRHNALREELPASFRLMNLAGLEIELFASYASERAAQGARLAPTTEGRTLDLLGFLEGWLDRDNTAHALLWDLIRHERALGWLARTAPAVGSSPDLRRGEPPTPPAADVVPRIRGKIVLHEMTSDPQAVARALEDRMPDLAAIPRTQSRVCYWRTAGPEVSILQLDELAFGTLGLVDGKRTAAEVYRALGGGRRPPPSFLRILGELQTIGIIALRRPR